MQSRPTHIIFDLDGTLLDSEPLYTRAAERVCQNHGATFTYAIKRAVMGGDTLHGARLVVEALQLPITPEATGKSDALIRELLSPQWPG